MHVLSALEEVAGNDPHRVAIRWLPDGENEQSTITYGALITRVRSLARWISRQGEPGDRVLLMQRPGPELAASLLAALAEGRIAVLGAPMRHKRADDPASVRARAIAQAAGAKLALSDGSALMEGPWVSFDISSIPDDPYAGPLDLVRSPGDVALLQFTSGSTSEPRGVSITHENLRSNLNMIRSSFWAEPGEVSVSWLPPQHDMGLVGALLEPLTVGMTVVWMPPGAFLQDPLRWVRAISRYRAAVSGGPDFAYAMCARAAAGADPGLDLSCWRLAYCGAERVRASTIEAFCRAFGAYGFRREALTPCYGLAEATLMVTSAEGGPIVLDFEGQTAVSCGRPRRGLDVRIIDPSTLAELPHGRTGEVWVSGSSVSPGYWERPEESALCFGQTVLGRGGFLRTGDLGALIGGELIVTGRLKERILAGGRTIAPEDIEDLVPRAHTALVPGRAAAFSLERHDREQIFLVAELRKTRTPQDTAQIASAVRRAVAEGVGVALDEVIFVRAKTLPVTTSGKLQRAKIREAVREGQLRGVERAEPHPEGAAPIGAEAIVLSLVAQRLGLSPDRVDPRRPLAEMGLDSRAAIELSGAIGRALGRPMPETLCWEHPSIAAIASYLSGEAASVPAAAGAAREGAEPIAIIGAGYRLPQAESEEQLLALLRAAGSAIRERRPPDRPDASLAGPGAFLEDPSLFDADRFGISPKEAAAIDPQQRLALECAWRALEDAAIAPDSLSGSTTGVFLGVSGLDWARTRPPGPQAAAGGALSIAASRVSYALDLRGPSIVVDTACSSSIAAIHAACGALRAGECDLALSGGVNLLLDDGPTEALRAAGVLSPSGSSRPFDASADGYVRGEGGVIFVLQPLSAALAAGRQPIAVICGSAVRQDGRSNGLSAPSPSAQRATIEAALEAAGTAPEEVGYIQAHGTGTPIGDPIEWEALSEAYARGSRAVGSIKANLGHLEAAAGAAGLLAAALAVRTGEIFPHPLPSRPSPRLRASEALSIASGESRWPEGPRIAAVSSFGFGGTNTHLLLKEPPPHNEHERHASAALVALCGRSESDLRDSASRWLSWLRTRPEIGATEVAVTLARGRPKDRWRAAFVASDRPEIEARLAAIARGEGICREAQARPRTLLLFGGQGEDPFGVAADACAEHSLLRDAIREALSHTPVERDALALLLGQQRCGRPSVVQPALCALAHGLASLLGALGLQPSAVLGHSLGEISAAIAAGVLPLREGMAFVARRGELTERRGLPGRMAAVAAPRREVERWCLEAGAEIAALQTSDSTTVAGTAEASERLVALALARGYRARLLPVEAAYHSSLMQPVLRELSEEAESLPHGLAKIPWYSTLSGGRVPSADSERWARHLSEPVRFDEALQRAIEEIRFDAVIEVGAGAGLARLAALAAPEALCTAPLRDGLLGSAAALMMSGAIRDPSALLPDIPGLQGAPGSAAHRERFWTEPERLSRFDHHPLLGTRVVSAGAPGEIVFQSTVSLSAWPELHDHRAYQTVVVAGASHVSLLLGAYRALRGAHRVSLADLTFSQGLVLTQGAERIVEVKVASLDPGARLRLASYDARSPDPEAPVVHAVGAWGEGEVLPPERVDTAAVRERCERYLDAASFYREVARHDIQAGPTYRWCAEAWATDGEALGRLVRPPEVRDAGRYVLHPGLIDSSFQLAAATATDRRDESFILFRIREYQLFRSPSPHEPLWAHAIRRPGDRGAPVQRFQIRILDNEGLVIASANDLELRRASLQVVLRSLRPEALDDLLYGVVWRELPEREARARRWIAAGEGCEALMAALSRRGEPAERGDLSSLAERLRDPDGPDAVLLGAGLTDHGGASPLDAASASSSALLAALRAISQSGREVALRAVTRAAMPEAPQSRRDLPVHAVLRGLLKSQIAERPGMDLAVIDWGEGVPAEAVAAELGREGEPEVAVRQDKSYVPRLERRTLSFSTETTRLHPDATYLVTGGLGGLGLIMARWLVSRGAMHLLLVSRAADERPEAREALEALRRLGVEVTVRKADVSDERSLSRALEGLERPIRGVIHAAGLLEDASIDNITPESLRRVLAPKLSGAIHLAKLDGLDFLVHFSSIAALLGSPGQGSYAAANSFLDAHAAIGPAVRSVAWGPWAGAGMAARQGAREQAILESFGMLPLDPVAAAEATEQVFRGDPRAIVASIDWPRLSLARGSSLPLLSEVSAQSGRTSLAAPARALTIRALPLEEGISQVEEAILGMLAEIAGVKRDRIAADRELSTLGLDSSMALSLAAQIRSAFGISLNLSRFLTNTSAADLARELTIAIRTEGAPERPPSPARAAPSAPEPAERPHAELQSGPLFGLFFFSRSAERSREPYAFLQRAAVAADRAGLHAIWLPERHFHPFGGLYPNPSVLAASLAPITSRVRLRAGSVVLPLHHPIRVAEEWAVVDQLSQGRVEIAVVRGWGPNDFVLAPDRFASRTEALREGADQLRRLWRGEALRFDNGLGVPTETRTWPRPVQPELPLWLTCTQQDERFIEAGRLGVDVLTALLLQSIDDLERRIALYREARASAGFDPASGRVALMLHTFIAPSEEEARDAVRAPMLEYLASSVDLWRTGSADLAALPEHEREQVLSFAFERYYRSSGLFGTPDRCAKRAAHLHRIGVDEIACLIDFGLRDEQALEGIAAIAELQRRANTGARAL